MRFSPRDWAAAACRNALIDIARDRALHLDRALAGFVAHAIACARDVDSSLPRDVDLGGLLAYAHDGDEDRLLAYARDIGLVAVRDRSLASDVNRVLDRLRDFDHDHDLALGIASEVDHVLNSLRDLGHLFDFDFDFGFDRALPSARDFDRDLGRLRELGRTLALDLTLARGCALFLARNGEGERAPERQRKVAPAAGWLTGVAVRLLPAGERARFREEFRSELWEIAACAGRRRHGQLVYAGRQVGSAWRLRLALRVPRRRGAVP